MKKILPIILSLLIIVGGVGCVKKTAKEYNLEILTYLEEKYNETFTVVKMSMHREIGRADVVLAECYSEKYPHETFEVCYHLDMRETYDVDEIIELLKKADCYDEEKMSSWKSEVEPYFEDDYSKIIFQNEFDRKYCNFDSTMTQTWFEVSNYYPTAEEGGVSLEEYMSSENYTLYACTQVFVNEDMVEDKTDYMEDVLNKVSVQGIARQYVYFYFTDKSAEFLKEEYVNNYDDLVMYFKNADYLTGYESYLVKKGIVQK